MLNIQNIQNIPRTCDQTRFSRITKKETEKERGI